MTKEQYAPSVAGKHDLQLERELREVLMPIHFDAYVQFERKRGICKVIFRAGTTTPEILDQVINKVVGMHPTYYAGGVERTPLHTILKFNERYQP